MTALLWLVGAAATAIIEYDRRQQVKRADRAHVRAQVLLSRCAQLEVERDAWKRRAGGGPLTDAQADKVLRAVFSEPLTVGTPANPIVLPELCGGVRPFGDFALYSELGALIGTATASEGEEV